MLDFLFGPPRRAASSGGGGWFDGWWGGRHSSGRVRTQAGVVVDEELALTYAPYFSGVRLIAETCAGLPIRIAEHDDDGNVTPLPADPLVHTLGLQPNPTMMALPWRESGHLHCVSWGQSFSEVERGGRTKSNPEGEVIALWPIHPSRVRPIQAGDADEKGRSLSDQGFDYRVRNNDGTWVAMHASEMLHVPGVLSEDGVWGKSVVAHARQVLGLGVGVERYGATWFGSGGRPRFAVLANGMRDKQARQNFREEWAEVHASPDSGQIVILPTDATLQAINVPPEDSQFLGTGEATGRQLLRFLRVPPHMVGYEAPSGDIETQGIEWVRDGLMRWLTAFEQQCSIKLIPEADRGRRKVEHVLAGLMRGNMAGRMAAFRTAITTGIMTVNECRRLEGLNSVGPDGDELYLPLNMQTLKQMKQGNVGRSGQAPPGRGGIGSDQSGHPGDDGTADGNFGGGPGGGNVEASFDAWTRRLGKSRRGRVRQLLADLESRLRVLERQDAPTAVALPAPARRRLEFDEDAVERDEGGRFSAGGGDGGSEDVPADVQATRDKEDDIAEKQQERERDELGDQREKAEREDGRRQEKEERALTKAQEKEERALEKKHGKEEDAVERQHDKEEGDLEDRQGMELEALQGSDEDFNKRQEDEIEAIKAEGNAKIGTTDDPAEKMKAAVEAQDKIDRARDRHKQEQKEREAEADRLYTEKHKAEDEALEKTWEEEEKERDARHSEEYENLEAKHVREREELEKKHEAENDALADEWEAKEDELAAKHEAEDADRERRRDAENEARKGKQAVAPAPAPSLRAPLTDTLRRLLRVEQTAATRATNGPNRSRFPEWLAGWEPKQRARLTAALASFGMAGYAARLAAESVAVLTQAYDSETKERFASLLAAWPDRAAGQADEMLRQTEVEHEKVGAT